MNSEIAVTKLAGGLSALELVAQSGPVAKLVLLILLFASVVCWSVIFYKWRVLKKAETNNAGFLETFWKGKTIDEIFSKTEGSVEAPVASVFKSGVKELRKLSTQGDLPQSGQLVTDNIERALARAAHAEMLYLERHVSWLATTASAAPFIGLFGTVWGIMNSFQNIGATGAANLAVVAPGISEALITTAAGIGAAIPAVIAYNTFAQMIRRQGIDMEAFSQDFLNIVHRSTLGHQRAEKE